MAHLPQESSTATESRLQRLVEASRRLVSELSLDVLLPQVLDAAQQIVPAEHAALAVLGPNGTIEQLLHVGPDEAAPAASGGTPAGQALLEAAAGTTGTIRWRSATDARLSGLAQVQPPIDSFLAVPIRSTSAVHGHLCLANRLGEPEFSAEDEYLVTTLAATAGTAVENARLYAEARRRQDWLEASAEVGHRLLAAGSDVRVLELIAESVARLVDADTVQVVLPVSGQEDTLEFAVSKGPGAEHARGLRYPAAGSIAWEAMQHPRGLVLDDVRGRLERFPDVRSELPITNLIAFPLRGEGQPRGSVVICRSNGKAFTPAEVGMAESFTNQAALALELADARADRSRLGLLEDRGRIARELQEHVLQKLFGAGLAIQGAATMTTNPAIRSGLASAITTLDDTIRSIRSSIFAL